MAHCNTDCPSWEYCGYEYKGNCDCVQQRKFKPLPDIHPDSKWSKALKEHNKIRIDPQMIISELLKHLPGTIITKDMGTCRKCGRATASGVYLLCVPCLKAKAIGLASRIDYLMNAE